MAIITISRQRGALGTEICEKLRDALGIPCFDRQTLEADSGECCGVLKSHIERFDEKKPSAWALFSDQKDRYLHFMKGTLYRYVRKNRDCIVLGRGGQMLFKGLPDVLRVSIVAPTDSRTKRLKAHTSGDAALAERIVRQSDRDRGGFHRFFFHVDWMNNRLYDLVINTENLTDDDAVRLLREAAAALDTDERRAQTVERIDNWCLNQDVIAKLCYEGEMLVYFLEVTSAKGVVTIKGSVVSAGDVKRAEEMARAVPGVKDIRNELAVVPMTYGIT